MENELSVCWQVSRVMVCKVLDVLMCENLLICVFGKGIFVFGEKFQCSMIGIMSFSELCQFQGCCLGLCIIKFVFELVDDEIKVLLNMNDGEKVVVIECICYVDDVVVLLEIVYFFLCFVFLLDEDFNNYFLYECLCEKYYLWFIYFCKMIELVYVSFEVVYYFGVNEGYLLILIKSEMIDNKGEFFCVL